MNDAAISQIVDTLTGLTRDINNMANVTKEQVSMVLGALDDIAAHTLAMQGIVGAILKKVPVDGAEVAAWIESQTAGFDATPTSAGKAKAIAAAMLSESGR
ncbi:MAG: hypothetical protein ABT940_12290 [Alphaproteobacteria bacterium]